MYMYNQSLSIYSKVTITKVAKSEVDIHPTLSASVVTIGIWIRGHLVQVT